MPVTQPQIQNAQAKQHAAAHDSAGQVRLVAGPGTGKSFAIEERVRWLLANGVSADAIYVVSFTRASSLDLRKRIQKYCKEQGQTNGGRVSVTTLHSLALRTLRLAGFLGTYPADPLVVDDWELVNIFDVEFSVASGRKSGTTDTGYTPGRCQEIRKEHEAFWGTGKWNPPNYIMPDPPITQSERDAFVGFHGSRTQIYSCVLPGEIVQKCVKQMEAGLLNPAILLNIKHLIVDEFQDLNISDLEFIHRLVKDGTTTFVAGDDDQSVYSFRFASPAGIQNFTAIWPNAGRHELGDCFRCTGSILEAAKTLIMAYPIPNRIPKTLVSLYANAEPPEMGIVYRLGFSSGVSEARAIAQSCKLLTDNDIQPREILVLISNRKALYPTIKAEFDKAGVIFEPPREVGFVDSRSGRFILGLLRAVCNPNDYVAHRLILGQRPGVGVTSCNKIVDLAIKNNLNYRDIFHNPLPAGVYTARNLKALNGARSICQKITGWGAQDSLANRAGEITNFILEVFGQEDVDAWLGEIEALPPEINLEELRDYLWADTDEQQTSLLKAVYERLNLEEPAEGILPQRVRMMTMHGAKGLAARVVFIPGLEEGILPNKKQQPVPGLVLEAARLLYTSITRARAACVLSYARQRNMYGSSVYPAPSRFNSDLGGRFDTNRKGGFTQQEVEQIIRVISNL